MIEVAKFRRAAGNVILVVGLMCLSATWAWPESPPATADIIVVNAHIYTVDARQPWAEGACHSRR